ncbi:MAG: hypothetical protein ACK4UP_00785 [Spirosomataceae bacterium]
MRYVMLFLLCICGLSPLYAQQNMPKSWEHVVLDSDNREVRFEQRTFRNPADALRGWSLDTSQAYVFQWAGVPLVAIRPAGVNHWSVADAPRVPRYRADIPVHTGKTHRLDFSILPQFVAQFGNFEQPVEAKTTVHLQTHLVLARGLTLLGSLVFPVENTLDNQPNEIRLGPIFANQFFRTGRADFWSISAGYFFTNQYGVNVQYRHWSAVRPWGYGFEASLSGEYYFFRRGQFHGPLQERLFLGNVSYRLKKPSVTLQATFGQFLFQDRGIRGDFIRQFDRVDVGLWSAFTTNGATLGFNLAIPLWPRGHYPGVQGKGAKAPRLRMAEEFRWEYNYTRGFQIGERYRLGPRLDERLRMYEQPYLQR